MPAWEPSHSRSISMRRRSSRRRKSSRNCAPPSDRKMADVSCVVLYALRGESVIELMCRWQNRLRDCPRRITECCPTDPHRPCCVRNVFAFGVAPHFKLSGPRRDRDISLVWRPVTDVSEASVLPASGSGPSRYYVILCTYQYSCAKTERKQTPMLVSGVCCEP